jgi:hypothetical protein
MRLNQIDYDYLFYISFLYIDENPDEWAYLVLDEEFHRVQDGSIIGILLLLTSNHATFSGASNRTFKNLGTAIINRLIRLKSSKVLEVYVPKLNRYSFPFWIKMGFEPAKDKYL